MRIAFQVFFMFSCLFAQMSSLRGGEENQTQTPNLQSHHNRLLDASYQYLTFMKDLTNGQIVYPIEEAKSFFIDDLKIVYNNLPEYSSRDQYILHWASKYEDDGPWDFNPIDIIVSPADNLVVLRLDLKAERGNRFYSAAFFLRYDQNYIITEIDEVFGHNYRYYM